MPMNSDLIQINNRTTITTTTYDDEVSGGKSTAMSNSSSMRDQTKNPNKKKDEVFELSLNSKPSKLKPLKHKSNNLAVTLLEDDKPPSYMEGVTTAAELDAEIKTYLDTNQIFSQLKNAFSDGGSSTTLATTTTTA